MERGIPDIIVIRLSQELTHADMIVRVQNRDYYVCCERGTRLGDPESGFIFNLIVEHIFCAIWESMIRGNIYYENHAGIRAEPIAWVDDWVFTNTSRSGVRSILEHVDIECKKKTTWTLHGLTRLNGSQTNRTQQTSCIPTERSPLLAH